MTMENIIEPIIGSFYTYYHSDYTSIALCFRRVRDNYYFMEIDDGGDPSKLWFNSVSVAKFKKEYRQKKYDKDYFLFEWFFDGLENLRTNHVYESLIYPEHELTDTDFTAIDNAVSIFRVANHINDEYGNNRTNYDDYIKSPQWRQIRAMMLNRFGKCQLCSSTQNLEVHHNSYDISGVKKSILKTSLFFAMIATLCFTIKDE